MGAGLVRRLALVALLSLAGALSPVRAQAEDETTASAPLVEQADPASVVDAADAADAQPSGSRSDPFESWNRSVYAFNDAIDAAVLIPVATGYRDHVPEPLRTWVGNIFGNFGDAWSTVNHVLQGKPESAVLMYMRVVTNTFLGFGGVLDIASEAGLERRPEDFGQTLGRWGVGPGPFLMLPLLGPSSLRETAALPLDFQASPTIALGLARERLGVTLLGVVHNRSTLLGASRVLDEIALDRYQFLRDAYLARRRNLVYDGEPPEEPDAPGD